MTESVNRPLRLLIVDDHEVVRQGLVALLDRREEFQVVAEAGSVAEATARREAGTPMSVILVMAPGASFVCSVLKTKCPVKDAWMPIWAVSESRISPTRITLGACRNMARIIRAKSSPIWCFTSTWLIPGR